MDVDVVCELTEDKIARLVNCFDNRFYISEAAVRSAVEHRSCFNLIHLPSSIKVDVFVSRQRPFDRESLRRATPERVGESTTVEVPIATAEDTIVGKLEWYRLTDETSERQWDDICRILRLLGNALDIDYLTRAAESVGVADLLIRLLQQ